MSDPSLPSPAPLVSVIIAVLNSERYLAECLDSVAAQTYPNVEIILVDGGSIDRTAEIAGGYRARLIAQTGTGFADAWNCGIGAAQGEYLAFIDSDDRWLPRKLERQVALLEADPALEGVIGGMRFFVEEGEVPPRSWRDRVLDQVHVAQMPGVLVARPRLFEKVGLWGADWKVASDIDWFLKLKDSGLRLGAVGELVMEKRVHGSNLSLVSALDRIYPSEVLRLLHASIGRKRAASGD